MVVIHKTEETKGKIVGSAIYLNPQYRGDGLYLNQNGGFISFSKIGDLANKGLKFVRNNQDIIKSGVEAGSNVVSAIANVKKAADEAEKLRIVKELQEEHKKAKEKGKRNKGLTEEEKRIIDEVIAKQGSGLKRF